MKTILILARPLRTSTGLRENVRIGDSPLADGFGLGGFNWEPAVLARPVLSMELTPPDLNGRVQAGSTRFSLKLPNVTAVPDAALLDWQGAPIEIYSCDELSYSRRVLEFTGNIGATRPDYETGVLGVDAEASVKPLEVPLLTKEYSGAGGLDGDAVKRGTLRPAGFGDMEYIEPVWFDEVNNIGQIDGYGNTLAITRLMEGANDWGPSVGNFANYAALRQAIIDKVIPRGRWGHCLADGLVGLGAPPAGIIGVNATFGGGKPGSYMLRLLQVHAEIAVGDILVADFNSLTAQVEAVAGQAADIGLWYSSQHQVKDLLESMAGACNATPLVTFQGKFTVTRGVLSAPVATLNRNGHVEPRVINWKSAGTNSIVYQMKARTARPGRVLTRDEVLYDDVIVPMGVFDPATVYRAGNTVYTTSGAEYLYKNETAAAGHVPPAATYPPAAPAADAYWQQLQPGARYADGTPIDSLKPAVAGATKNAGYRQVADPRLSNVINPNDIWVELVSPMRLWIDIGGTWQTAANYITAGSQIGVEDGATKNPLYRQTGIPAGAVNGSFWIDTSTTPNVLKQLMSGVWQSAANLVTRGPDIGVADGATLADNVLPNPLLLVDSTGWTRQNGMVRTAGGAGDNVAFYFTSPLANGEVDSAIAPVPAGSVFYATEEIQAAVVGNQFLLAVDWYSPTAYLTSDIFNFFPTTTNWITVEGKCNKPAAATRYVYRAVSAQANGKMGGFRLASTQGGSERQADIVGADIIFIKTDSGGTALAGQLPRTESYSLRELGGIVAAGLTWAITNNPTGITVGITGAGVAALAITGLTAAEVELRLKASGPGRQDRFYTVMVRKDPAAPPSSGGAGGGTGGTSSNKTVSVTTASTSATVLTPSDLSVTVGSAGQVALSAAVSFDPMAVNPAGDWTCYMRWQREISAVWTDIGAAFQSALSRTVFEDVALASYPADVSHNMTATGLTVGSSQKFRLVGYISAARSHSVTGECSAQG